MASNSQGSLITDGYVPNSSNNNFTSMWCDKRSATNISLSLTFTGSGTPDGYAQILVSNAPENYNVSYGSGPFVIVGQTLPPDAVVYPNSAQTITTTGSTHWDITTAARWIAVQYVSTVSSANLQVYVFASVPFESP